MKNLKNSWQSLSRKQKAAIVAVVVAVIAVVGIIISRWQEEPKHWGNWHHPNPSERPVNVELKDANTGSASVFYDIAAEEGGMGWGVQSENGGLEYPEIANTTVELAVNGVQQLVEHVVEDQTKPDVVVNEVIYTSENGDANIVDIDESTMEDLIASGDTADKEVTVVKEERKADPQPTNPEPKKTEEEVKPSVEIKEVKKEEPAKKEEVKEEKQEEKEEYIVEVSEDTTTVDLTEVEMDLTPVQTINPENASSPEVTTFVASEQAVEDTQAEAQATLEDLGW